MAWEIFSEMSVSVQVVNTFQMTCCMAWGALAYGFCANSGTQARKSWEPAAGLPYPFLLEQLNPAITQFCHCLFSAIVCDHTTHLRVCSTPAFLEEFCGLCGRWWLCILQVQNAGNKLGRRCDMCSNYEKQLQGIQIQEAETRDQVGFLF